MTRVEYLKHIRADRHIQLPRCRGHSVAKYSNSFPGISFYIAIHSVMKAESA